MASSKKWVVVMLSAVLSTFAFLSLFEPTSSPIPPIDSNLYIPTQEGSLSIGFPDAAHELRIFFAPTCSHCAEYHRDVMPILVDRFITRSVVRITPLLFARHAVDMALMKIFLCRGDFQMYPAFLVWLAQMDTWLPIFSETDLEKKKTNLKKILGDVVSKNKMHEVEVINALKIDLENPEYRHYVALYALLNGYKVEEIIMALDNDELERRILSMKLKAVDNNGKLVQLIPAAYWDGQYIEGVPGAEQIDWLILQHHDKAHKEENRTNKKDEKYVNPDQSIELREGPNDKAF